MTASNLTTISHLKMRAEFRTFSESRSRLFAGDAENQSVSFAELFHRQDLSVAELVQLAAYVIIKGSVQAKSIDGLDILTCKKDGVKLLPDAKIAELTGWANERDTRIKRLLFSGPEPFWRWKQMTRRFV